MQAIGKVIGYLPLGGQTQNTSIYGKSTYPDASASFYIKREFAPDHPDRLLPAYDCGDHLHPSPAGYRAMGEAISLSLFAR